MLKYQISGTYYVSGDENQPIGGYEYPPPMEETSLPEEIADSLLKSNVAWTPAEFKKVKQK